MASGIPLNILIIYSKDPKFKICNHTNMYVLIFECLIGQEKMETGKSGKSQGIWIFCVYLSEFSFTRIHSPLITRNQVSGHVYRKRCQFVSIKNHNDGSQNVFASQKSFKT